MTTGACGWVLEGIFYLVNKEREMRVAVVQMNSGEDKAQNLSTAERLLLEAAERGAELAVLPELFTYLGRPPAAPRSRRGDPGPDLRAPHAHRASAPHAP